jgi:hypothetical protein
MRGHALGPSVCFIGPWPSTSVWTRPAPPPSQSPPSTLNLWQRSYQYVSSRSDLYRETLWIIVDANRE